MIDDRFEIRGIGEVIGFGVFDNWSADMIFSARTEEECEAFVEGIKWCTEP